MMKDRLRSRSLAVSGKRPAAGAGLPGLSGRKVLDLRPGPNDVRVLAPGVYFVCRVSAMRRASCIAKITAIP
jgi:hypothetical protein